MNAEVGEGSAPASAEPESPGALLRKQRERRALSVQQAAEDLHLDAGTIEAMEADRFQALGAPVYAKGHLRKYAMLLGLSPELVIERYEALSDTPVVPTPVPERIAMAPRRERRSLKVPIALIVIILLIALGWWVFKLLTAPTTQAAIGQPDQAAAVMIEPTTIQSAGTSVSAVEAAAPVERAIVAPAAVVAQTAPVASANAARPGEVQLTLEFSAPSWAEVYDAAGSRLMFDTGAPGRVHTMKGLPPLRVTLGFASVVTARLDGRAIVVPRSAGKDAAKFVIEADGSVR